MAYQPCACTGCEACGSRCVELVRRGRCTPCTRTTYRTQDARRGTRTERGLDNDWLRLRNRIVKQHVADYGYVCPGWQGPPHPADPKDNPLTGDHIIERDEAPELRLEPTNVQVLCRSCNTSKSRRARP